MNLGAIAGASAALGSSNLQMQEVIDGATIYIKLPAGLASKIPGSKPWLKMDLSKLGAAAGIPGLSSLTGGTASQDPSQFLQYLTAVSGGVTKIGTEQVNGQQTTHYRATIPLDKVLGALPASQRAQAQQTIASLEKAAGVHAIPVDVWIDSSHLVRRLDMAFTEHVQGQPLTTNMQIDIPQYGPQPAPQTPAAGDTVDMSSLLSGLGGLAGAAAGGTATTP
jgi:hypothetical protein